MVVAMETNATKEVNLRFTIDSDILLTDKIIFYLRDQYTISYFDCS